MNLEKQIRISARKYLPTSIRKPLGNLCGTFRSRILYPFFGLIFDLKGGRFKADGCVFIIPKNITTFEFRACFLTGAYEADERMLVRKYILPEDGVLELGACLGIISCITNKLLRNPIRHLVVEANPYCIPAIHQNRNLNQAGFLVENCAVSNQVEVNFFINPTYITGSTKENSSEVSMRLPGRSLQELNARHGPFSVLIMDIEGSELEILESSLDILRQFRLVIIELHDWVIEAEGANRCREILQQSGFRLVERSFITEAWLQV
jgi:FkbM family methyltransferase